MPQLRTVILAPERSTARRTVLTWADFGLTEADLAWHEDAACVGTDPDSFYPEPGPGLMADIAAAKRVCARCPVRRDCLRYALDHGEREGIWGGLSPSERRRLAAARRTVRFRPGSRPQVSDDEVARMTRAGKTAREIACALGTTPRTVVRARARIRTHTEEAA